MNIRFNEKERNKSSEMSFRYFSSIFLTNIIRELNMAVKTYSLEYNKHNN